MPLQTRSFQVKSYKNCVVIVLRIAYNCPHTDGLKTRPELSNGKFGQCQVVNQRQKLTEL